ncbi:MAG: hypothetical protein BGN86_12575 [Caulobacterales bacterium 68-7]|nr:MAG: hypothetical protein BGN86_12575 [Caulobacterales bacterium 68-7]
MFFDEAGRFGTSHLFSSDKAFVLPLTRRGFFSEFQTMLNSWVFSALEGRHLFVLPQEMNVTWDALFDLPLHDQHPSKADYIDRSVISIKGDRREAFDRMRATLLRYAARPLVKIPQIGLKMPLEKLMARASQAAFRPKPDIHQEAASRMADLGLLCDFYAIHLRGGDKIAGEPQNGASALVEGEIVAMARYMDPILAENPEPRVFVMTDDYRRVTELRVNYPEADFVTLCPYDVEGYFQSRYAAQDLAKRTADVRALLVEVVIANCAKTFYGPYLSNVSQFIHQLRYPRESFSVDSATQWTPVRTRELIPLASRGLQA